MRFATTLRLARAADSAGLRSLCSPDAIAGRVRAKPEPEDEPHWIAVGLGWLQLTAAEAAVLVPSALPSPPAKPEVSRKRKPRCDRRLTTEVLDQIEALRAQNKTYDAIAKVVGVAPATVGRAVQMLQNDTAEAS